MNSNQNLKISIITICFNSETTIEQTIKSIIRQDYANKEYIIIDGGSTDNTMKIVEKYSDNIDYYISEKDKGRSNAFNKGIAKASGDVVILINSDDFLLPGTLTEAAKMIDGSADLYCGNLILWNSNTDQRCRIMPSMNYPTLPFFKKSVHQGIFATKDIYNKLGGYDEKIKYAMDLDFLMRATKAHAKFKHIDIDIAVFKLGGATSESVLKKKKEYMYIIRKNGGSTFDSYLFYYFLVITQTIKKCLTSSKYDIVRQLRYKSVKG